MPNTVYLRRDRDETGRGGGQDARATVARASCPEPCASLWYHSRNTGHRGIPNINILHFTTKYRFGSRTRSGVLRQARPGGRNPSRDARPLACGWQPQLAAAAAPEPFGPLHHAPRLRGNEFARHQTRFEVVCRVQLLRGDQIGEVTAACGDPFALADNLGEPQPVTGSGGEDIPRLAR